MLALPDRLKSILHRREYGTRWKINGQGRVQVFAKLPDWTAEKLPRWRVDRNFLNCYKTLKAPVLVWLFDIKDDLDDTLWMAIYFNVLDQEQVMVLKGLASQKAVPFYFVRGKNLSAVATKTKSISPPENTRKVFQEAMAYARMVKTIKGSCDQAKLNFQAEHSLDEIAEWQPSSIESCAEFYRRFSPDRGYEESELQEHVMSCEQCRKALAEELSHATGSSAEDPETSSG